MHYPRTKKKKNLIELDFDVHKGIHWIHHKMTGDWAALQEKRAKHATEALSSDSSRPSTSTLPPPPPPAPTGPLPSQLPTPSSGE